MSNLLTKAYWDTKLPIYEISHSKLVELGIKCLLIDVDGTLVNRNSEIISSSVRNWVNKSKDFFELYLISNNHSEKRIARIGSELGINYKFKAFKPRRKNTLEIINKMAAKKDNIAIIGDRIFTDILVGNRCKIKTILVKQLNKEGTPVEFNLTTMLEKFFSMIMF